MLIWVEGIHVWVACGRYSRPVLTKAVQWRLLKIHHLNSLCVLLDASQYLVEKNGENRVSSWHTSDLWVSSDGVMSCSDLYSSFALNDR